MNPTEAQLRNRRRDAQFTPDKRFLTPEQIEGVKKAQETVSATQPVTIDALESPETPLRVPEVPAMDETVVPSAKAIRDSFLAPSPQDEAIRKQEAQILALTGGQQTEGEIRQREEEKRNIEEQQRVLKNLSGELDILDTEAITLEDRLQESVRGRGVTEGGLRPIRTAQMRDLDTRRALKQAEFSRLTGNLQGAQALVEKAVALQFERQEFELGIEEKRLEFLKDARDRGDIKLDAQREFDLLEREREIQDKKERLAEEKVDKKDIYTLALSAAENGASDLEVQNILNSPNFDIALQHAAPSLRPKEEVQTSKTPAEKQLSTWEIGQLSDRGFDARPGDTMSDVRQRQDISPEVERDTEVSAVIEEATSTGDSVENVAKKRGLWDRVKSFFTRTPEQKAEDFEAKLEAEGL